MVGGRYVYAFNTYGPTVVSGRSQSLRDSVNSVLSRPILQQASGARGCVHFHRQRSRLNAAYMLYDDSESSLSPVLSGETCGGGGRGEGASYSPLPRQPLTADTWQDQPSVRQQCSQPTLVAFVD